MKPRSMLTAAEVYELLCAIEGRLHTVGIETQPEIAARILDLVADPDAGLRQYADVVRADPALSGRLLRLANSAFFAQREPVTNLDRACVLLGLERLKAVSLGFHLSRAATGKSRSDLSRRIWGQGVFRACLAAELSRNMCPGFASEAFVIGLMLDCGIPLLCDLLGDSAAKLIAQDTPPGKMFRAEFDTLPFTHVDIATVLGRRWKLPDLLARPIERHHTQPGQGGRPDPVHLLHRVAYYVGAVHLDAACKPSQPAPMAVTAEGLLGLNPARLGQIVSRAGQEYSAMADLFRDVAGNAGDVTSMADSVHGQLVEIMDQVLMSQVTAETRKDEGVFTVADHRIEIEAGRTGVAVAYLVDASGTRLLSYVFRPGAESVEAILEALGIDHFRPPDTVELDAYLRSLAA